MGTVLRFAAATIIPLSVAAIVWSAPATASAPKPAFAIELGNQPYVPPNNGGPSGTTGSGSR